MKIINWLVQNKDWLFSGGGVAFIAFLYTFYIRKKEKKVGRFFGASLQPEIKYSTKPTPDEIIEKLNKTLPFEQKRISESYNGLAVEWETRFRSINAIDTKEKWFQLTLSHHDWYPWIYCEINILNYPALKIAQEGTKIIVKGIINKAEDHSIYLKDAKIKVEL